MRNKSTWAGSDHVCDVLSLMKGAYSLRVYFSLCVRLYLEEWHHNDSTWAHTLQNKRKRVGHLCESGPTMKPTIPNLS